MASERQRLRPGVLEWRLVEGEVVAVDIRRSTYIAVNRSGALLWPALIEGAEREGLIQQLQSEYGLDADAAKRDVDAFLELLRQHDLLETQ